MFAMLRCSERRYTSKMVSQCPRDRFVATEQTYSDVAPKKLNQPHVLLVGGNGTRSLLQYAVVSS